MMYGRKIFERVLDVRLRKEIETNDTCSFSFYERTRNNWCKTYNQASADNIGVKQENCIAHLQT